MSDHGDHDPCPNCSQTNHEKCCARCGSTIRSKRLLAGKDYCTAKCEQQQQYEDRISAAIEANEQTPRLDKSTRAGLHAIRSLADVTLGNGIDMTGADCSRWRLAIQWLDYQLNKKR